MGEKRPEMVVFELVISQFSQMLIVLANASKYPFTAICHQTL